MKHKIWVIITMLFTIGLASFVNTEDGSSTIGEIISETATRISNNGIKKTMYTPNIRFAKNSNNEWVDSSDVISITKDSDDISFNYFGINGEQSLTLETGVTYGINSNYYSMADVKSLRPNINFDTKTWKYNTYRKYGVNITGIEEVDKDNLIDNCFTFTYKNHSGFELNELILNKNNWRVKNIAGFFSDLKDNNYDLKLNLSEKRIYACNITEDKFGFDGSNYFLWLDPTTQYVANETGYLGWETSGGYNPRPAEDLTKIATAISDANMDKMGSSNNVRHTDQADPFTGNFPAIQIQFKVSETPASITQLDYATEGWGDGTTQEYYFYVWNFTSSAFKEVGNTDSGATDVVIKGTVTDSITDLVNSTGHIVFSVWGCSAVVGLPCDVYIDILSLNVTTEEVTPYNLTIVNPTTASPVSTSAGSNITINFTVEQEGENVTTGLTLLNITVGEVDATIASNLVGTIYNVTEFYDDAEDWGAGDCPAGHPWDTCSAGSGGEGDIQRDVNEYSGIYDFRFDDFDTPTVDVLTATLDLTNCSDVFLSMQWANARLDAGDYGRLYINDGSKQLIKQLDENTNYDPINNDNTPVPGNYTFFHERLSATYDFSSSVTFSWDAHMDGSGEAVFIDEFNITCTRRLTPVQELANLSDGKWQVNATMPSGLTGLQDLYLNVSLGDLVHNTTQTEAVDFGGNNAPTTPVMYHPDDNINYTEMLYINYSSTDEDGEALTYYIFINDSLNLTRLSSNVTTWNATDGYYNITVMAYDQTDYSSNSSVIHFRLDNPPDAPTIHYPSDNINYSDIPYINYSATDQGGASLTYFVFINDTLNYTSTTNLTDWNASEGYYNVTVMAGDERSNSTNTTVHFRLDVPKLGINFLYPITNQINVTQYEFFNVTVNVTCHSLGDCGKVNVSLYHNYTANSIEKSVYYPNNGEALHDGEEIGSAFTWNQCDASAYSGADLNTASTDDSNTVDDTYAYNDAAASFRQCHRFAIPIDEQAGEIHNISIGAKWITPEGTGQDPNLNAIRLYIGNTTSKTWKTLTTQTSPAKETKTTIQGNETEVFTDFINATGYVHIMVEADEIEPPPSSSGDQVFSIYYLQMNVTYNKSKEIVKFVNTSSDLSFFTNESNPRNISLGAMENKTVVFYVNATDYVDSEWIFFATANWTQDMTITNQTSFFNLTIVQYPKLGINFTYPTVNINATRYNLTKIIFNVTCSTYDCEKVNISLFYNYTYNATGVSKYVANSSGNTGWSETKALAVPALFTYPEPDATALNKANLDALSVDDNSYYEPGTFISQYSDHISGIKVKFNITEEKGDVTALGLQTISKITDNGETLFSLSSWIYNVNSREWEAIGVQMSPNSGTEYIFNRTITSNPTYYVNATGGDNYVEVMLFTNYTVVMVGTEPTFSGEYVYLNVSYSTPMKSVRLVNETADVSPMFTNDSNPRNISLLKDESVLLPFFVNFTGVPYTTWSLFASTNLTSDASITDQTSVINFTILPHDTCTCPPNGNWHITDNDQCTLDTTCNIVPNSFRVLDGAMRITHKGNLIANGCFVNDTQSLFINDSGGLYCGT